MMMMMVIAMTNKLSAVYLISYSASKIFNEYGDDDDDDGDDDDDEDDGDDKQIERSVSHLLFSL